MDMALITAHLVGVAGLAKIGGAIDFAAAAQDLRNKLPAAYAVPGRETASPNQEITSVLQRVEVRFAIVLAISNQRDARGEKAQSQLEPVRDAVKDRLLGWPPSAAFDPCEFAGGRLLALNDAVLWWQDEFVTAHFMRNI
jgi:hypothetical protein